MNIIELSKIMALCQKAVGANKMEGGTNEHTLW